MATARKFKAKDRVLHLRTLVPGRVEQVRADVLGGSRTDTEAYGVKPSWVTRTQVRDEVLVSFEDGSVSWTDSQDIRLLSAEV